MKIDLMDAFFDELEKIAALGEPMPGSGRLLRQQQAAGTAQRAFSPARETGKDWIQKQVAAGRMQSPAHSAMSLAYRQRPAAAVAAAAKPVLRGALRP